MSWFAPRFNSAKLKVNLKLCNTRLQMLQKKKENLGVMSRKEIAKLLEKGKDELARIRVEQIIREDYIIEVLEILELYCSLLTSRFGLIENKKECDVGLKEAVCTMIWVTPHLAAEVAELKPIASALGARYGKEFVREALENRAEPTGAECVSSRVVGKVTEHQHKPELVDGYLMTIATTYRVPYTPRPPPVEPIKPPPGPEAPLLNLGVPAHDPARPMQPTAMFPNPPGGAGSGAGNDLTNLFQQFPVPPGAGGAAPPSYQQGPGGFPAPPGGGGGFPEPLSGGGGSALYPPGPPGGFVQPSTFAPSSEDADPTYVDVAPPGENIGGLSFPEPPGQPGPGAGASGGGGGGGGGTFRPFDEFASEPAGGFNFPEPPGSGGASGGGAMPEKGGVPQFHEQPAPPPAFEASAPPAPPGAGGGAAADAPPDFDELTRRFNAIRSNSSE